MGSAALLVGRTLEVKTLPVIKTCTFYETTTTLFLFCHLNFLLAVD